MSSSLATQADDLFISPRSAVSGEPAVSRSVLAPVAATAPIAGSPAELLPQTPDRALQPAPGPLGLVDLLLRDGEAMVRHLRDREALSSAARALLLTIAAGGAAFGAALGSYRGGWQIAMAALKLPLVILFTAAICAPALSAINSALGRTASLRQDLALVLAALARGTMVLAALAPLVLLAVSLELDYHRLILLTVVCCSAAGLVGLALLLRGLWQERRGRVWASLILLATFALVGAQLSWTLRPYLVRPRTPQPPLVRSLEGSFFEAVDLTLDSARGVYRRPLAPLPGEESGGEP